MSNADETTQSTIATYFDVLFEKGQKALEQNLESDNERSIKWLLDAVNNTSGSARSSWMFFLALMGYLLVALATVSDRDLLTNSPVELPIIGIGIPQTAFFMFGPLVLVLIHFGIMMQHVVLAQKTHDFNRKISDVTERGDLNETTLRRSLNSYFFTQSMAGTLSGLHRMIFMFLGFLSFTALPLLLLTGFQASFLAYHDAWTTWWHRALVFFDIVLILVFVTSFYAAKENRTDINVAAVLSQVAGDFCRFSLRLIFLVIVLLVSVFLFTIPDEDVEEYVLKTAWVQALGLATKVPGSEDPDSDHRNPRPPLWIADRLVQWNMLRRNLSVTDNTNLVRERIDTADGALVPDKEQGSDAPRQINTTLSLRGRDLRYAQLDRTDLRGVDFSGAILTGASLRETRLSGTRFDCMEFEDTGSAQTSRAATNGNLWSLGHTASGADRHEDRTYGCQHVRLDYADLRDADLGPELGRVRMGRADLSKALLARARMLEVDLEAADLSGADLTFTNLQRANLNRANLSGAELIQADLSYAQLNFARLTGARFLKADLRGAEMTMVHGEGATFESALMSGSNASLAHFHGADFSRAQMHAANLRGARFFGASMIRAQLNFADLSRAKLHGANLSGAKLLGGILSDTEIWQTIRPGQKLEGQPVFAAIDVIADITNSDDVRARYSRYIDVLLKRSPEHGSKISDSGHLGLQKLRRAMAYGIWLDKRDAKSWACLQRRSEERRCERGAEREQMLIKFIGAPLGCQHPAVARNILRRATREPIVYMQVKSKVCHGPGSPDLARKQVGAALTSTILEMGRERCLGFDKLFETEPRLMRSLIDLTSGMFKREAVTQSAPASSRGDIVEVKRQFWAQPAKAYDLGVSRQFKAAVHSVDCTDVIANKN